MVQWFEPFCFCGCHILINTERHSTPLLPYDEPDASSGADVLSLVNLRIFQGYQNAAQFGQDLGGPWPGSCM